VASMLCQQIMVSCFGLHSFELQKHKVTRGAPEHILKQSLQRKLLKRLANVDFGAKSAAAILHNSSCLI
jgi:hypothetical protein